MINRIRAVAVAAALVALPAMASAQDRQFDVGTKLFNVGLLLGDDAYGSIGAGAGLEFGFKNIADQVILGIGGSIGFRRSSDDFFGYSQSLTAVPVLGFVHGHYQVPSVPKLDLYAGPAVGVAIRRYSFDCGTVANCGDSDNDSDVSVGVQAGSRWALTPAVLGWAQLSAGNNLPFLSVGVSFKF
ncbi:MAG: outer membrane beta-barrel protein [Phycisphaerae bacterium]|nr:outer membrane beta-barrel protein [Gemmatimonadaceae bacterium]